MIFALTASTSKLRKLKFLKLSAICNFPFHKRGKGEGGQGPQQGPRAPTTHNHRGGVGRP
eukprot:11965137-Karenia_brevis.AAC.1